MSTKFPKEQIVEAYNQAPDPVRNVFNGDDTVEIIVAIQNSYGLHIDTAGMIGQEIGYLLLGLTTPKDFYDRLHSNGLPTATVTSIVKDVNEKIFVPLQKKMREQGSESSAETLQTPEYTRDQTPAEPTPEPRPAALPIMQVGEPSITPAPPAPVTTTPSTPASPGIVPSAPIVATPPPAPLPSIPAYEETSTQPTAPKFRTMASDMQMLANTRAGTQAMAGSQSIPQQTTPARSFQTSSVPATENFPKPTPQSVPVPAVYSPAPSATKDEYPTFNYKEAPLVPPAPTKNNLDPYREPTE